MVPPPDILDQRRREVLRQAGVALGGQPVTLWEASPAGGVVPLLTCGSPLPDRQQAVELALMLQQWSVVPHAGRWVATRLDGPATWCIAPLRTQPAAPPPDGVERRSHGRMALELAGMCLGMLDAQPGTRGARLPEAEALLELARHPSVLAHEVANPLTAALASLELALALAQRQPASDPRVQDELMGDLTDAAKGIERAVDYLRAIQDRTRGAHARSERFDAVKVVQSCVLLERPFAGKQGVGLSCDVRTPPAFLRGDPNGLYQMLANLIRNAVHASRESRSPVTVSVDRIKGAVQVIVGDRGTGIAPEHIERIFEPGFTTKELGAGSGLGLAIVRNITEAMFGGTVRAQSEMGRGSLFTLTLPIPPQRASGGSV